MRTQTIYYNLAAKLCGHGHFAPADGTFTVGPEGQLDRVMLRPEGAQVGGAVPTLHLLDDESPIERFRDCLSWLRANKIIENGRDIGLWRDPDTGWIHVDVTEWIRDEDEAIHLAWERGEKAIWSWESLSVIPTSPDTEEVA